MRETLSFVFCTNSAAHLREFAKGLVPLSCLMGNSKMELVVVSPEAIEFGETDLKDLGIQVVHCRSPWGNRNTSRNLGYRAASGSWVYFVDQDVRFPDVNLPFFADALSTRHQFAKDVWLASGPYQSHAMTSFWGKVYNELSNSWLENPAQPFRFLAGNVLMRKMPSWTAPFSEALLDGGEEVEMAERLRVRGGRVHLLPEIAVIHLAEHDLSLFWKRLRGHLSFKIGHSGELQKTKFDFWMFWRLLKKPLAWPGLVIYASALFCEKVRPERTLC